MITIIDYGLGNTGALLNMFEFLGFEAQISDDPHAVACADQLVLPGVGSFDRAMINLRERHLESPLKDAVLERQAPVLGVCLGMQLLAHCSEEGGEAGLGLIAGQVKRISVPKDSKLKVPNIGWRAIRPTRPSVLFDPCLPQERFYFVHGYHMVCEESGNVAAVFDYGSELCCAVEHRNIFGVQFHPEKSHRFGMRLLTAFASRALGNRS